MVHAVHFYDPQDPVTELKSFTSPDWDAVKQAAVTHLDATGDLNAIRIAPDATHFTSLSAYLDALNTEARWLDANPQNGCWIGQLTEDLDHWAAMGVHTPLDLAAYLDGEVMRERRKSQAIDTAVAMDAVPA